MMFDSALLESGGRLHTNQRWTASASVMLQMAAIATIVVLSMVFTDQLPLQAFHIEGLPVPPGPPPQTTEQPRPTSQPSTEVTSDGHIQPPTSIPVHAAEIVDPPAPPTIPGGPYVPGSTGPGGPGGNTSLIADVLRPTNVIAPPKPPAVVRLSQPEPGSLIYQVRPTYPHLAVISRVQGTVILHAMISPQGRIEGLQVVSGPALLIDSAVEAVKQWRYKPYMLNGQPITVDTQITVNFVLGGN